MIRYKRFIFGLFIGGVLTAATMYGLSYFNHRMLYPAGTWVDRAAKSTMRGRRVYTLPLNNPDVVPAKEADHLNPDDIVVGITVEGLARGYPWWILSNYHVVNDTVGQTPVYVGFCEKCSAASAFSPVIKELSGRPLTFQISGLGSGTFQISDVQTLSYWHPFSGVCVGGSLKGRQLKKLPSVMTRWEEWKKLQPNTDVVYASSRMRYREHGHKASKIAHPDFVPHDANLDDDHLPTNELVYGLVGTEPGQGLAFPLRDLKKKSHIEVTYKNRPFLIFLRGDYRVTALVRKLEDMVLTFELISENPLRLRDQTGTVWDSWGKAVSGQNEGAELGPARGYVTEWYEWVSGWPDTEIYLMD